MPALSALDAAHALAGPVGDLGSRWMLHPDTLEPAKEVGYANGLLYYAAGRGGVLGDVDADVVTAAFGFFPASLVQQIWPAGIAVEGARAAARRYATACAAFGRARLAGVDGLERLAELAERVVAGADVAGLPLFAGWRAEPLPDDAPGRAYQLIHVLRELRGSVHIVAVVASGLSPLDAILTSPTGGPEQAKLFGWPEPFADTSALAEQRAAAEALTDQLMARHLEVLDPDERGELVELVRSMRAGFDTGR